MIPMGSGALFVAAALAAVLVVTVAGIAVRAPLARVPENSMKFVVGVMLTSFGIFWGADVALLVVVPAVALFALALVALLRRINAQPIASLATQQGDHDAPHLGVRRVLVRLHHRRRLARRDRGNHCAGAHLRLERHDRGPNLMGAARRCADPASAELVASRPPHPTRTAVVSARQLNSLPATELCVFIVACGGGCWVRRCGAWAPGHPGSGVAGRRRVGR